MTARWEVTSTGANGVAAGDVALETSGEALTVAEALADGDDDEG